MKTKENNTNIQIDVKSKTYIDKYIVDQSGVVHRIVQGEKYSLKDYLVNKKGFSEKYIKQ